MQVLVLAAQNAVDYRLLGVATSGVDARPPDRRLDRRLRSSARSSRTGSATSSSSALPHGVHVPTNASPAVVHQLPPVIHALYVAAVAAALHPVFLTAAGVMVGGVRTELAAARRAAARDRRGRRHRRKRRRDARGGLRERVRASSSSVIHRDTLDLQRNTSPRSIASRRRRASPAKLRGLVRLLHAVLVQCHGSIPSSAEADGAGFGRRGFTPATPP